MSDSAYDLTTGTVLDGRYQIVRELGRGGMSTVYLAEHALIGRRVAVKVLHTEVARSAESVARFMAEARAVGTLGHPNVVASTDMGHLPDGRPYLILEYLEGWTLAEELESTGTLPFQRAAHIALQIASGVGAAHDRGIVHRDLKSDNVFLVQTEHTWDQVKILDFGISKFLETPLETGQTQRGIILGTPEFMAPEQIHSPELVDHRADIYALGTILHHMLTGKTPFENTPAPRLWNRILHEPPRPITASDVPGPLADFVQRLLAKDPADRPQSMLELFDELSAFGYLPGADRRSSATIVRAPATLRSRSLPLEAGHPTPLPTPMTHTQAEHTGERQPGMPVARVASPPGGLPAPGEDRARPQRPGVTPGSAAMLHHALRDSRPSPSRAGQPTPGARRATGAARRRTGMHVLMLLLLVAGAGAGIWLAPMVAGTRAAAPPVATTEPSMMPADAPVHAPAVVVGADSDPVAGHLDEDARVTAAAPAPEPDPLVIAPDEDAPDPQAEDELEDEDDARDSRRRRRDRRPPPRKEGGRDEDGPAPAVTPAIAKDATPRDRQAPAPGVGRVDPAATRRVVRAHLGEIRTCHERGRMDAPGLTGRVVVRVGIGRAGQVTSAVIASSTLGAPSVEKCITSAVQRWRFPAPTGAGTAIIEYPFVLK